ncbi:sensor histidine kinase [Xenorhabdus szentirmaii]|uniref:histidine kinase n=2 Tax=Xenorhabdus szentirmaii TaxID=290112 RepID=W1IRX4_9GAMM|nr:MULTISPECIES: HAMP domain-containing sensor histidine kinase [Xenorhabdus]MBD2781321.1 HAMP domain-containing histidine kinase [Xenorhabdus sp. 38]MBD2792915.1 HAMP domain-containing histidine kinase [Xenorhabdus sp. CUL]MBD2800842.1 HAMP domain-containing histidine kinase [Xenorhabdus sp. M]MBD2806271.1 HAMP domain-containing histidine kinase [Xenorhabdus sp. ZM]MBD2820513.1 HAMP domain-containing histidine kinase [Xenorhabdus sp. 42]
MIFLKKWRLFPRSLRQLVLMAFWLVLLPLLVLAYQAYQSLDQLSAQAAEINRSTLANARRSEAMTSAVLEMERSYRQYCVLGDARLEKLYQSQYRQYSNMLGNQMALLASTEYTKRLNELLSGLSKIACNNGAPEPETANLLEEFSSANNLLVQETRSIIFSSGEQLQKDIADKGQFFGWQSLILFLLSAFLIALFTRMIIGPVKRIELMINRLGEGHSLENQIEFKGPRELRSLAQRIIWLSERLSWLESQRHEFLRHISHELKTPLASMREGTELLADEIAGPLTSDQKDVVSILNSSSKHLQQLIEQLLEYNRKLADISTEHQIVSLKEIVGSVVLSHQLPARTKNINTEIQLDTEFCWAEPNLLAKVIDNIYSNAVHYGAESGNIWIYSRQAGKNLQIDIANTGTPISELESSMIFEPFYQGKLQRKGAVKGSGLGLSIAQDCIKRMGGEIHLIESGFADVCFRIELPLTAEND